MLAKTPPMGWNPRDTFGPDIDEQIILETADTLVEKGCFAVPMQVFKLYKACFVK